MWKVGGREEENAITTMSLKELISMTLIMENDDKLVSS